MTGFYFSSPEVSTGYGEEVRKDPYSKMDTSGSTALALLGHEPVRSGKDPWPSLQCVYWERKCRGLEEKIRVLRLGLGIYSAIKPSRSASKSLLSFGS